MTAYRDRVVRCPRCVCELARGEQREIWECPSCRGMLVGVGELVDELLKVAPDLMPAGGARTLATLGRRSTQRLLDCPTCAAPMEPVFLAAIDVDRCFHDDQIWFDATEHDRVIERATSQKVERDRNWLSRLLHDLFAR